MTHIFIAISALPCLVNDRPPSPQSIIANDLASLAQRVETIHVVFKKHYRQPVGPEHIVGYSKRPPSTPLEKFTQRFERTLAIRHEAAGNTIVDCYEMKWRPNAMYLKTSRERHAADGTTTISGPRQDYFSASGTTHLHHQIKSANISTNVSIGQGSGNYLHAIGVLLPRSVSYSLAELLGHSDARLTIGNTDVLDGIRTLEVTVNAPMPSPAQNAYQGGSSTYLKLWLAVDHYHIPVQWQIWNSKTSKLLHFHRNVDFRTVRDQKRGSSLVLPFRYQRGHDPSIATVVAVEDIELNLHLPDSDFRPSIPNGWNVVREGVVRASKGLKGSSADWRNRIAESTSEARELLQSRGAEVTPAPTPTSYWSITYVLVVVAALIGVVVVALRTRRKEIL
ncbi:hypothetical protein Pan216_35180 [Planctomycetes bacterium Pan216]|uniref:Uncharacterized protein n=1 Tax=Kolteria novifilia TaxID=2527975 RepID=A0A518B6Q8_9BACT|nr:hypothetical protein Pan216_35180 [Planctomycetes bacterium Pan216]